MIIEANTREHAWQGRSAKNNGSFRPRGQLLVIGERGRYKRNPRGWSSKEPMLAARLFVGFNVGGEATWSLEQLVTLVDKYHVKHHQGRDTSFLAQKGIYTNKKTGETVREDGGQVIILNLDGLPEEEFVANIDALAEHVAREFIQEEVVVEIQKAGQSIETFAAVP